VTQELQIGGTGLALRPARKPPRQPNASPVFASRYYLADFDFYSNLIPTGACLTPPVLPQQLSMAGRPGEIFVWAIKTRVSRALDFSRVKSPELNTIEWRSRC
jgi:hypothetical protein